MSLSGGMGSVRVPRGLSVGAADCAQHQRGVRPGAERAGGQPNRGDSASGGIAVITHKASKNKPASKTKLLIVRKCSCRACGETGN